MSPLTSVPASKSSVHLSSPTLVKSRLPKILFVLAAVLAVVLSLAVILCVKFWPFSQKAVIQDLAEAADSSVTIRSYHPTYFPVPGCVLEGVEFRHGSDRFKLITIDRLRILGSYPGILHNHVPRINVDGAQVFIPPLGSNTQFHSQHSNLYIGEIAVNGGAVEYISDDPQAKPLRFDVHEGLLRDLRWGTPILYRLKFHNPEPPGELSVTGKFGAWADGHPEDTPMSGEYTFEHADLGVFGGIAGILASRGKFDGVLKHINITGTTDTPDFRVTSSTHRVRLQTHFDAYVDAMHGDTYLNRVEAHFGRTTVLANGSVAGSKGSKGKTAKLQLAAPHGRIEDILGLFITDPRSPMSGDLSLMVGAELPPGDDRFLDKVRLNGAFGIDDGSFSKPETQKDVNALSAGARGQSKEGKEDPETVLTNLKGRVELARGVANFSDLDFGIPGAHAKMHGTFNIVNHKIDLHGQMWVDTKISKTTSGMKSFLLKVMDPIFKKKKKGEIVPVHIEGTYEKPECGLDLTSNGGPKNQQSPK